MGENAARGHWSLVIGHWSLAIGHWLIGHWLIGHWPLAIGHRSLLIAFQGTAGKMFKFTPTNWLFLFLSAIATGLSWLFYFYALSKREATWVAPIDKSSLAFTFILGVLILGERITWQNVLASVLVLAALGVTLIPSKAGAARSASAPTLPVESASKP